VRYNDVVVANAKRIFSMIESMVPPKTSEAFTRDGIASLVAFILD
jgi:hypothetical protein